MIAVLERSVTNFAVRLRRLREDQSLTQQQVADRMDMTEAGYRHYESGRSSPSADDLPQLAQALGVSVRYLMERLGFIEFEGPERTIEAITRNVQDSPEIREDIKQFLVDLLQRSRRENEGQETDGG